MRLLDLDSIKLRALQDSFCSATHEMSCYNACTRHPPASSVTRKGTATFPAGILGPSKYILFCIWFRL
jgi:hypothetical protein